MSFGQIDQKFWRAFNSALVEAFFDLLPGGRAVRTISGAFLSTRTTLDERLQKIEVAKANLLEAVEAIEELKIEAEDNRAALAELTKAVTARKSEKDDMDAELASVRSLMELETGTVQRIFRVPTRAQVWAERFVGFLMGVAASLVAAYIYSKLTNRSQ
ncbi:MAG: hypothetical protein E5W90_12990 [Mesorhizobium sp.]|nr:MAG: hypothetical protein E5W90_12990 [Mesorhizobium sp.]